MPGGACAISASASSGRKAAEGGIVHSLGLAGALIGSQDAVLAIPFDRRLLGPFLPLIFSGSRPGDSEDEKLRKGLLMGGSILILPIAVIWGCLYAGFGERTAAIITLAYAAVDLLAIVILNRSGNRSLLNFVHQYCTLLLPFVLTLVLGGLAQSSALIIGAFMAPLGALLYYRDITATRLFIGYVVLVALAGVFNPYVLRQNQLPVWLIVAFFVLNVIIVSSLAFFQLRAFMRQRAELIELLRIEQDKTDRPSKRWARRAGSAAGLCRKLARVEPRPLSASMSTSSAARRPGRPDRAHPDLHRAGHLLGDVERALFVQELE